jgi:mono/diheme cytochrome c family protein
MRFFVGLVLGILLVLVGFFIVFATGSYNVSALSSPSKFERKVATFTLDRSIAKRAPSTHNPFGATENLRAGRAHYRENCVTCHGAPGVEESEAGMGLNPAAPDLTLPAIQRMSDGELFWVISNGIRMTGMPAFSLTHKPDEIWKIVAFVRHLPEISADEQKELKAATEGGEGHHEEGPREEGEKAEGGGGGKPAAPPAATPGRK